VRDQGGDQQHSHSERGGDAERTHPEAGQHPGCGGQFSTLISRYRFHGMPKCAADSWIAGAPASFALAGIMQARRSSSEIAINMEISRISGRLARQGHD
jgi:hypothetical protein